ncbi:CGNR zinc finger domain-containing protein [Janibacter cremeus]|uniref:CGNR zinc finger domain-containing protein n=1 Tax=Janibacter cremeus TaxID=1285192 RepID=UPI0023F9F873|nr:CGNR zinc finger domain-containing protein [Janibacter cremeus]WEV76658.1 CGNR zinc finger domain-containing protein [Janibacter cremeus]
MTFAHDTEVALRTAAALVNTGGDDVDTLATTAELDEFYVAWGWTGRHDGSPTELAEVRALRPRLHEIWLAAGDVERTVGLVNELLRTGRALPQLVEHGDYGWHIHATDPEATLAQRMQVEAAMAFVDVVRVGELSRLRVCAAADCDNVLVDLSRNRSRRYCEGGCGNRLAAAAYRSRREG